MRRPKRGRFFLFSRTDPVSLLHAPGRLSYHAFNNNVGLSRFDCPDAIANAARSIAGKLVLDLNTCPPNENSRNILRIGHRDESCVTRKCVAVRLHPRDEILEPERCRTRMAPIQASYGKFLRVRSPWFYVLCPSKIAGTIGRAFSRTQERLGFRKQGRGYDETRYFAAAVRRRSYFAKPLLGKIPVESPKIAVGREEIYLLTHTFFRNLSDAGRHVGCMSGLIKLGSRPRLSWKIMSVSGPTAFLMSSIAARSRSLGLKPLRHRMSPI